MNEVLADTGPLFALADPDDQFHARAQDESSHLERSHVSVVIAYPTVLEAYNLILRHLTLPDAHRWLAETISAAILVNPTPEDYNQAAARALRYTDQSISLVDAVNVVLSERLDLQVWTYDHHFDTLGASVWR